jgi:hypothetical protein
MRGLNGQGTAIPRGQDCGGVSGRRAIESRGGHVTRVRYRHSTIRHPTSLNTMKSLHDPTYASSRTRYSRGFAFGRYSGVTIGLFLSISLYLSVSRYYVSTLHYYRYSVRFMVRMSAWGFCEPAISLDLLAEFPTLSHNVSVGIIFVTQWNIIPLLIIFTR